MEPSVAFTQPVFRGFQNPNSALYRQQAGGDFGIVKRPGQNALNERVFDRFAEFVGMGTHPCVGASAAFKRDEFWLAYYTKIADINSTRMLARDLFEYLKNQESDPKEFATFVATFSDSESVTSEAAFEEKLWMQLSQLDELSAVFFPWDQSVSKDPSDSKFSFSFGGKAFYVVGLHKGSSRMARSFKYPTPVFNLHSQFEALRSSGRYNRMRDTIRGRDQKLQGSMNPMMKDFRSSSEAKQYSGRETGEAWKCPFHSKT